MGNLGAKVALNSYDVNTAADRFLTYSSAFRSLKIFSATAVTGTAPTNNTASFTADAGTNYLTSASHGLSNGDQLNFLTDGTLPGGLETFDYNYPWGGELYYVINKTTNTFQVSLTQGGSAVDITSAGSGTHDWYNDTVKIVVQHNFGYLAPAIWVYNGSTTIGTTKSYFMSDAAFLPLQTRQYTDRTEVYQGATIDGGATNPGATLYFTCYQFLDTFDEYTSDTITSGTTTSAESQDYGIKVSKDTFDVKTCASTDLVLSSSFLTSIIQKKGTDTTESISHGLGYIPSYLGYIKPNGESFLASARDQVSVSTTELSGAIITLGDVFYYVIFKAKSI